MIMKSLFGDLIPVEQYILEYELLSLVKDFHCDSSSYFHELGSFINDLTMKEIT